MFRAMNRAAMAASCGVTANRIREKLHTSAPPNTTPSIGYAHPGSRGDGEGSTSAPRSVGRSLIEPSPLLLRLAHPDADVVLHVPPPKLVPPFLLLHEVPLEEDHRDDAPQDEAPHQLHDQARHGLIREGRHAPDPGDVGVE